MSTCSGGGQGEQRGSWFNSGWLRLPSSDPTAGGSYSGAGDGAGRAGGGTGLFGLGGSHGTGAAAAFAGRAQTIGESSLQLIAHMFLLFASSHVWETE